MIRLAMLSTALFATACSASPDTAGKDTGSPAITGNAQAAPITDLPDDSPLEPEIKNIPAATGRANLPLTPPPFAVAKIGEFDEPFAMAFLPGDQGLLVTEKAGALKLRRTDGGVVTINGVPKVVAGGQGGLLDVAIAPDYAASHHIYLSYAEPGPGGSALALARATLDIAGKRLADLSVIWRSGSSGPGGQFGSVITFSPDGQNLFLTSGERQRFTPAQDPKQALGKILRLTLDGKAAPGNPMYDKGGIEAMTWTSGHRNPYGLVFAPDGKLWEDEMGPRGGDELNLILPGKNYGWPIVSNGDNYSGQPIPDHPSRPDLEAPKLWWNPSVSPAGMIYYSGDMFPALKGSLLIGTMSTPGLAHVTLAGDKAHPADFWDFQARLRDIAQAPDGSIWLLEDGEKGSGGRLLRLTPKG